MLEQGSTPISTSDILQLAEAEESLRIVQGATRSQRALLSQFEAAAAAAYAGAEDALRISDEAGARAKLEERQTILAKAAAAEVEVSAAEQREQMVQRSVLALSERAASIEATMAAALASSTAGGASEGGMAAGGGGASTADLLDPLEAKFRKLEGL